MDAINMCYALRFWWLLTCLAVAVKADPDLRQLLHLWRPLESIAWSNEITTECARAMDEYSFALSQRQQWASTMLDATGNAAPQYLQGSSYWLGSRHQCEQVNEQITNETSALEYPLARYVVFKLKVDVAAPLIATQLVDQRAWYKERHIWLGVCVPGACGEVSQASALLRHMLESSKIEQQYRHVELVSVKSLPIEFSVWTLSSTWLLILLCVVIVGLTMLGTIFDQMHLHNLDDNKVTWKTVVMAFSIPRNARSMFNMSVNPNATFPALHGVRVLTMSWIILGHLCMYITFFATNPGFREIAEENLLFQILINATVSVDTFFFVTGVLLAYVLLNAESGKPNDNFIQATWKFFVIIQQRVLRLILPYIFTILLVSVTFPYLNADSVFESQMPAIHNCPQNAWRNILFINNLYHGSDMCVFWGWYLGADMQLYVLGAALLLLFVNGYQRTAILSGTVALVAAWLTTGVLTYNLEFYPKVEQYDGIADQVFSKPWMHVGAVWIGIITGWMLHRDIKLNINKIGMVLGWILCAYGIFNAIFLERWREHFHASLVAISVAFRTTFWAISVAWILVNCVYKRAGLVRKMLELPVFLPLGRITYCAYLLHIPLLEWVFLNLDGPQTISRGMNATIWFGFIVWAYAFGTVVSLLFESPVIRLLALLRSSRQQQYKSAEPEPSHELQDKNTNTDV